MNGYGGHLHIIAGPGRARKIAFVLPKRSEPGHNFVALGDLVFNTVISRSRLPEQLEGLLQPFSSGRERKWRRIVVDIIFGDHLVHSIQIAFVNLFVIASDERLVLFW